MTLLVNKNTKKVIQVQVNKKMREFEKEYPPEVWIRKPNLSAVRDVPSKYWNIAIDNTITPMTAEERVVVDRST